MEKIEFKASLLYKTLLNKQQQQLSLISMTAYEISII